MKKKKRYKKDFNIKEKRIRKTRKEKVSRKALLPRPPRDESRPPRDESRPREDSRPPREDRERR